MNQNKMLMHKDLPIYYFATGAEFYTWLSKNYERELGFWLRLYKKASTTPSISIGEAVDVALCFGWIDGLTNRYDEESYLIRFTQRRPKSVWSKVNVEKVKKLIADGRMQPSGIAKVNAAKADGRWDAAYSGSPKS